MYVATVTAGMNIIPPCSHDDERIGRERGLAAIDPRTVRGQPSPQGIPHGGQRSGSN